MPRRDKQIDYLRAEDRMFARARFPHPTVMNVGTGRFNDALDALDAKDALLTEAVRLLQLHGKGGPGGLSAVVEFCNKVKAAQ